LEVDANRDEDEAEDEEAWQKQEKDEADVGIGGAPMAEDVHHPEANQDKSRRRGDGAADKAEDISAQKEEGLEPIFLETAGWGHEGRLVTKFFVRPGVVSWRFP
jgi:hypothetical protein